MPIEQEHIAQNLLADDLVIKEKICEIEVKVQELM